MTSSNADTRPLTILINASAVKMSGVLTYLVNFAHHLAKYSSRHKFIFYVPPEHLRFFEGLPKNFDIRPSPASHSPLLSFFPGKKYTPSTSRPFFKRFLWDQITLRRIIKKEKVNVLVSINFSVLFCPCSQILWLQNALYFSRLHFKILFQKRLLKTYLNLKLRRWLTYFSVRSADLLLFPTEALKAEVLNQWRWIKKPAYANHYGHELEGFSLDSNCPQEIAERLQSARSSGKTLYYPSLYDMHKDLPTVLRAFKKILKAEPEARLLLTPHFDLAPMLSDKIKNAVVAFRDLPYGCVPAMYKASDIVLFSSYCESFGLPLLEAMSYGIPVVAADIPTTRELCGDAARYAPVFDDEALANEALALIKNPETRKMLGAKARKQAEKFRWQNHIEIFHNCLNEIVNLRKAINE